MDVDNKGVIVLSGASSGIGLAISRILLLEGFSVIGIDKNFTNLEFEGENFKPITIDLSNLGNLIFLKFFFLIKLKKFLIKFIS